MQVLPGRVDGLNAEELKSFISEFWGLKMGEVNDSTRFNAETIKGFTSIKFYRFVAALEDKFSINVKNVERIIDIKTLKENSTK